VASQRAPVRSRKRSLWIVVAGSMVLAAGLVHYARKQKGAIPPPPKCPADMRPIAGGSFEFGGKTEVNVPSFCLDATEVSLAAYAKCVHAGGCEAARGDEPTCNAGRADRDSHPINCVSWKQARSYCAWLGRALPTEREWEYAARGGEEERAYPWGEELATDTLACWNRGRSQAGTCEIGAHAEFAFALRDMAGNVTEWVEDQDSSAAKELAIHDEPIRSSHRITRGGSWSVADPMLLQGKLRFFRDPGFQGSNVGMRCALR
jgi:sulfatase modifying factor 1